MAWPGVPPLRPKHLAILERAAGTLAIDIGRTKAVCL